MFHFFEQREKNTDPHSCLAALAAGVTAAAIALATALIPPATHTAHAADAVAQTVEVSSYNELKDVVDRIGADNDRSNHTIVVKKEYRFRPDDHVGQGAACHLGFRFDGLRGLVRTDIFRFRC